MKALDKQEGGSHYQKYKIQPVEFITKNNIPYMEGNAIKYIVRHRSKNGLEDLKKCKHYIDLMIEHYYSEATPKLDRTDPMSYVGRTFRRFGYGLEWTIKSFNMTRDNGVFTMDTDDGAHDEYSDEVIDWIEKGEWVEIIKK